MLNQLFVDVIWRKILIVQNILSNCMMTWFDGKVFFIPSKCLPKNFCFIKIKVSKENRQIVCWCDLTENSNNYDSFVIVHRAYLRHAVDDPIRQNIVEDQLLSLLKDIRHGNCQVNIPNPGRTSQERKAQTVRKKWLLKAYVIVEITDTKVTFLRSNANIDTWKY